MSYILELFKGSGSIGKAIEREAKEVKCISLDFNEEYKPDICIDFLEWDYKQFFEERPQCVGVWASPPCQTYSLAARDHHRKEGKAVSKEAKTADKLVSRLIRLIEFLPKTTPWFIENPRGKLQQHEKMMKLEDSKHTVYYCAYGFDYMKPTHLWTNTDFKPEGTRCFHRVHTGSITKITNIIDRYRMPAELCDEIILSMIEFTKSEDDDTGV
jgi:hypothetical protein